MIENLLLKDYMKEDALLFDKISTAICSNEKTDYEQLLTQCQSFEDNLVLFKILPTYYVMRTILAFKLNDYETAHKYINGSLKYLLFVAKNATALNDTEQKNFEEYKTNVINQYKILTQEKPEYLNVKSATLPKGIKFITTRDESLIENEQNARVLMRKE